MFLFSHTGIQVYAHLTVCMLTYRQTCIHTQHTHLWKNKQKWKKLERTVLLVVKLPFCNSSYLGLKVFKVSPEPIFWMKKNCFRIVCFLHYIFNSNMTR